MSNKASNAPGFGNGNGKLKDPKIKPAQKKTIFLPSPDKKVY